MVREGYKQTEVGVIPEDWDVKQLRTALRTSPQYGINAASVAYQGGLPTYIRITDISEDGYFKPEKLVSVKHSSASQYFLEEGDLVFARTGASVGKSYLYRPQDGRLVYAGFLIKVQPDKTVLLPSFLSQYVNTKAYWNWVQLMSMRSGQPGINGNEYGQLLLPIPKLEEQRSIAQALSDVDALIAALDKAIAKKRAIKTATMQQLLTGKKRLPGFGEGKGYKESAIGEIPEDWEAKRLKHISPSQSVGLVINPSSYFDDDGSVPMLVGSQIHENHIDWESAKRISKLSNDSLPASRLIAGDLVTVRVGEPGVTAVVPPELDGCNCASMMIVRQHLSFSSLWLCYVMNSPIGKSQIEHVQYGTAQKQFNISDAVNFLYPVPPFNEQQAIATVLSDMGAEIAALETRLAKTQALKQGMMQALLTGRVRLV